MISRFLEKNWKIAKWVALWAVIFEVKQDSAFFFFLDDYLACEKYAYITLAVTYMLLPDHFPLYPVMI